MASETTDSIDYDEVRAGLEVFKNLKAKLRFDLERLKRDLSDEGQRLANEILEALEG
jgi:hypothetical protein